MDPSQRVIRNSVWMVAQPLLLNLLSLAVVGYMARVLGQDDYGRFIYGFTFVAMFAPFANMGLRAVTVRDVAKHRDEAAPHVDTLLSARVALAVLTTAAAALAVTVTDQHASTKLVVYLASLTILLQAPTTTLYDIFQAHERMVEVASVQAVSGLILTLLSVVVLVMGFRLGGLTVVYVFGSLLALLLIWTRYVREFPAPRLVWNVVAWWRSLVRAAPFFVPSLIVGAGGKIGVLVLSSVAGDAAVGQYGAASGLVDRLMIIQDGICTAFYPTMIRVYQRSPDEAGRLFSQFFGYMLLLGLPIAVGTTVLADPIISLIYGPNYRQAAWLLAILSWWLLSRFLTSLQSWAMGAIHRERLGGAVAVIATVSSVVLSIVLIPRFGGVGAAVAALLADVVMFILFSFFIRRHLVATTVDVRRVAKIVVAAAAMGAVCYSLRGWPVWMVVAVGAAVYAGAVWAVRILTPEELRLLEGLLLRRRGLEGAFEHDSQSGR
jgi:O-antigen/teichoic acid export membrane protein